MRTTLTSDAQIFNGWEPNAVRLAARVITGADTDVFDPSPEDAQFASEAILRCWHTAPHSVPAFLRNFEPLLSRRQASTLRCCAAAAAVNGRLQVRLTQEIARVMGAAAVPFVVLKGVATALCFYRPVFARTGTDVDLCVARDDIPAALGALKQCGFEPAEFDHARRVFTTPTDFRRREEIESAHYELGFWVQYIEVENLNDEEKAGFETGLSGLHVVTSPGYRNVAIPVVVDVHHALALDISADEVLRRPRLVDTAFAVHVPPVEWMALHALFKVHFEGTRSYGTGLQNLADFARAFAAMDPAETEVFARLVEKHGLQSGAYHVLRRWNDLGIELTDSLAAIVKSWSVPPQGMTPARYHDGGDPWPRLFSHL